LRGSPRRRVPAPCIAACLWVLAACASPVGGGSASDGRLYDGIGIDEIESEMRRLGLRAERRYEDGLTFVRSGLSGYEFTVTFYDCDGLTACEDLQLRAYFENHRNLEISDVNEWNETRRFIKLYLDRDGDLAVEMDVPVEGGVTSQHLTYVFEVWDVGLNEFVGFVQDR
jgi:hypothetical protein